MKKLLLLLAASCYLTGAANAQCAETDLTRVLIIGDSWANFIGTDQVINTNLEKWGHSNYKYYTNAILAENGTETTDFLQPVKLNEIAAQLTAHPDVKVVHLSIGGNDVLNQWNKNWSVAKTDSLLDSVYARIFAIIDFIKVSKPGVKILWSGYAYPNFGEIINDMAPFQSSHPFYGTWTGMGSPNFTQINTLLNIFSDTIAALAAADPDVDFVKATGLMQYTFGQAANLTVPPGGNYAAQTAPLPEGFPDYPSPKNAMRNYIIFKDCFHLAPASYDAMLDYQTRKYYQKTLMDDQYFLSEGGTRDGSVSSTGNVSTALQLGEGTQEEYSTVLSFNTTVMPDTGVSKASIFLRRESLNGTNPVGINMQVRIVSGNFGASADVEAADYSASGNATDIPCQFGSTTADGHWIRLDLPAALLPYISHLTTTQFAISAQAASGGLITFSDATDPELAPVLNVVYGPSTVSVAEVNSASEIHIYPNPTNGPLFIDAGKNLITQIEIIDVMGKTILHPETFTSGYVDISSLSSGIYFLKISSDKESVVKQIVKR